MQRPEPIAERHDIRADAPVPDDILLGGRPVVLRGLVRDWPMVRAAQGGADTAAAHLSGFVRAGAPPAAVTVGPPEIGGRFFYDDAMRGFNFRREQVPLDVVLRTLLNYAHAHAPPAIYVASTTIDTWLPGFNAANTVDLGSRAPLASIWIGNRTRIAAHQDLPDNLACVAAGRRRVTLFPPDQLANLYIGPLDLTPAGQPISLVDFAAPDLTRFPKFVEAMRHAQAAELEPGDAVFIPSLWWHHMEGLAPFNVLVNYWWRQSPAWMDTPMNALMLALMSVRDLPAAEREHWREIFRHYVFDADDATADHVPAHARRVLAPLDDTLARELRAKLLQRLNR